MNALTRMRAYPLPYMDEILRNLQRAKYISTTDLNRAYHQIPLEEESKYLTAFAVPDMGLIEFNQLPYGVAGGSATFQELSDRIIRHELKPYALCYIDDTDTATEIIEKHLHWLEDVLHTIITAGFTINREKSKFCRSEVKFLGILMNRDGFGPDSEKVDPILEYPVLTNFKQLRRSVGLASWYRKFMGDFAMIAEPDG